VEKQFATARGKVVQLERELAGANAQVLEAKRGQLTAVRAAKASEAAHKGACSPNSGIEANVYTSSERNMYPHLCHGDGCRREH
jgi:hypothetical protein